MNIDYNSKTLCRALRVLGITASGICLWLAIGGCATVVQYATREHQPLSYVGEMQFGTPVVGKKEAAIPISFSGGDWYKNSAIVPYRISGDVRGSEINVHVMTAVASKDGHATNQMVLSGRPSGIYHLYYLDPDGTRHDLGKLTIPK